MSDPLSSFPENSPPVPAVRESTAHGEAAVVASQETAGQVVRVAAQMAMINPRKPMAARAELLESCQRPGFASAAEYSFPRGGKTIRGPSVDLAREGARCWGNIQYGFSVVSQSATEIHLQGFAWDLQANLRIEMEDRFRRLQQRTDRNTGETKWVEPDERDLRELVNRKGALLVRNCLLQVLPPDLVDEAVDRSRKTLQAVAKNAVAKNPKETAKGLVDAFAPLGVTVEMLEDRLGHNLEVITAEEYAELVTVGKSLRDGQSKREEHFEVKKPAARDKKKKDEEGKGLDSLIPDAEDDPFKKAH